MAVDRRSPKPPPPGWYGKRATGEWFTDARIWAAGASRQIVPCFDLAADMQKPGPATYLRALFAVVVFLALGAFVAFAVMGQRPHP